MQARGGGLGATRDVTVRIVGDHENFRREGGVVDPSFVGVLVSALEAPHVAKPDSANLGITESSLRAWVSKQDPRSFAQATKTTKGQTALFQRYFTDPGFIASVLPTVFDSWHTDDYPIELVEINFEDGSNVSAFTTSQHVIILPWCVGDAKETTYNANLSRLVAALLPLVTVNKDRLTGSELLSKLT